MIGIDVVLIKKPKPKRAVARKPAKRCYELTSDAMIFNSGLTLIHGEIPFPLDDGSNLLIRHAWLFDRSDDTVFDTTDQKWYASRDYDGIEHTRYDSSQVVKLIHLFNHSGPWFEWEIEAAQQLRTCWMS